MEKEYLVSTRIWPNVWVLLMWAWMVGIAFWSIRLIRGWRRIRHIAGSAVEVSEDKVLALAQKATTMLGLRRIPRILVTEESVSPFLFGVLQPVLVIPAGLVSKVCDEALWAVCAHEFAHLRRRDPLVGWILAICEVIYFFHPAVYFVKRRILFEREKACDECVIAISKARRSIYANALISAAGVCRTFSAKMGPVGVVVESFGDLKKRLNAIGSNLEPKARLSVSALIMLVIIGAICVPGVVLTARPMTSAESEAAQAVMLPVKTDVQVEVEQGNESSESKNTEDYYKIPSGSVVVRVVDTKGRIIPIKDIPYTRIYYRDTTTGNPIGWQIDLQIEKTLSDGSLLVNHRDVLIRKFLGMNREAKRNDYTISMCFQPKEGPIFSTTMLYPQNATDILSFVVPPKTKVAGVGNVVPDELAGRVVDVDGNPVAGATISVYPDRGLENHPFKTDSQGAFRISGFGDRWCLYIKVEKDGYATQWLTDFEIGKSFIVTMDQSTILQGVFVNDSGEQAGRMHITLAKNKLTMQPRRGNSVGDITITHETDDKGSYDFPVEPGLYDVSVASESGLFNRLRVFIGAGQIVSLPSTLKPGIRFQVKMVDSLTNKPIKGVSLWIESRTAGRVAMKEGSQRKTNWRGSAVWESLMPGNTSFSIMKKGYCRWWSDACLRGFGTFKPDSNRGGYNWQRNIDSLGFDLVPDMPVVVIKMEKGVKLSGRVLSPEGKPVAKAWVDVTPTENPGTLTGDSRYRMITDEDGRFGIEEKYYRGYVPAGKQVLYNLCAHDHEGRWANAVSKPFASKPGDEFEFTLKMTKGGWVSGRVIDSEGKPVPDIEVEAVAKDNLDSPYFKPRTLTDENGTFTLGPMREGKYWIQPDTMKGVNIARSPKQEKTEVKVVDGKVTSVGNLLFRTGGPNM
ncbi:MAG TPA: M56 family metallopeptidase [Sedimentisphaerales bacterium]|nr:M56 family metallopeptidase [Sedimentisphaerales bacterium]